jgi:MoaA/NifB/PqqE/SkfB family radical SAM enzyme
MFKFNELNALQIEITNRCQAACPLCARNVHGGLDNPIMKLNDWSLDDFKRIFNKEVLLQIKSIDFAGTAGEPTLNKDLIAMCDYVKTTNPAIFISIFTNGGARNSKWWSSLVAALPANHNVVFALDGLEDTNHLYRVNVQYDLVVKHAEQFIDAGGYATWQFIQFKHNQHQVDEAKQRAKDLGFNAFSLKTSRRHGDEPFKVLDRDGTITHYLESSDSAPIKFIKKGDFDNFKKWDKADEIHCYVKKNREIYIDANYITLPCCIMGSLTYLNIDYNKEYYKQYNVYDSVSNYDAGTGLNESFSKLVNDMGGFDAIDASKVDIKSLLESEMWQTIMQKKWKDKDSDVCIKMCSASSPFSTMEDQDTYVERFN